MKECKASLHGQPSRERGAFKVELIIYIFIVIFGLITGSFLNVCISRIPEDASIIFPPSHCPKCKAKLGLFDLVPIFSYLLLRGRCRYCKEKISVRYPIVEALTAALFLLLYLKIGFSVQYLALLIFFILLMVISVIDMEKLVIPDILVLIGIGVGMSYAAYSGTLIESLQGICFSFVFIYLLGAAAKTVFKKEALGEGDIKLLVMFGANIGIEKTLIAIFGGSILGAVVGVAMILLKKMKEDDYIPFAPFLALGAVVSIFMECPL